MPYKKVIYHYKVDSILLFQMICNNCNEIENKLIKMFKIKYDHDKILEYKKICYNIFVNESKDIHIFYDYNNYNRNNFSGLLTAYISDLYYSIFGYSCLYSDQYYDNKKIKITNKPRLGVIYKNNKYSIEKQINDYKNIGITNIIISIKDDNKCIYNNNNYLELLDEINNIVKKSNKITHIGDIFFDSKALLLNYFLWCCKAPIR
jgi:hypothetical protein